MRKPLVLFAIALLVVAGFGGAWAAWMLQRQAEALFRAQADLGGRLDRIVVMVADVAASQQAYVLPGQSYEQGLGRVSAVLQHLVTDATALSTETRSAGSVDRVQTLIAGARALIKTDATVRENLQAGQDVMASDLILGEGRATATSMLEQVTGIRTAEAGAFDQGRAELWRQLWIAVGAAGTLAIVALILLGYARPRASQATSADVVGPAMVPEETGPPEQPAQSPSVIDVVAAADICSDLARLTSPNDLSPLLERTAVVADATGLIVWLGHGEHLVAVATHGYDRQLIARLPPLHRNDQNATAAAWRTGQTQIVAGDVVSNGAVVVPMFAANDCIGVLAAEVRHGREHDTATGAVMTMVAAQLGAVVGVLPVTATPGARATRLVDSPATPQASAIA